MRQPRWYYELEDVDDAGENIASAVRLGARSPVIAFAVGKPPSVTMELGTEDPAIKKIRELRSRVKAYRVPAWDQIQGRTEPDSVLRAHNHVISAPQKLGRGSGVQLASAGPWELFGRRLRQAATTYAALGGTSGEWTATDQGAITKALIDDENRRFRTGIRTTTFPVTTGVARTVKVPRDKSVAQAITDMANAFGGFDIEIVPVDNEPAVLGDLRIHPGGQGVDNLDVFLEHGSGKRNIIGGDWIPNTDLVSSHTSILGRTDGANQWRSDRVDMEVVTRYQVLLDSAVSYGDIANQAMLDTLSQFHAEMRARPRELLRIELAPTADIRPFDDFNLGDRITARIEEGRVDIDGSVRIWGFEISPSPTGEERLTALTIEPGA